MAEFSVSVRLDASGEGFSQQMARAGAAVDDLSSKTRSASDSLRDAGTASDDLAGATANAEGSMRGAASGADTLRDATAGTHTAFQQLLADLGFAQSEITEINGAMLGLANNEAELAQAHARLTAAYDPMTAAADRFGREMIEVTVLVEAGAISQVEAARFVEGSAQQYGAAVDRIEQSQMRASNSGRNLAIQLGDVAQGFAAGANPMSIFAQEGDQVISAFGGMFDSGSRVATFLGGPWTPIIVGAVSILGSLGIAALSAGDDMGSMAADAEEAARRVEQAMQRVQSAAMALVPSSTGALDEYFQWQGRVRELEADRAELLARRERNEGRGGLMARRRYIPERTVGALRQDQIPRCSFGCLDPCSSEPFMSACEAMKIRSLEKFTAAAKKDHAAIG